MGKTVSSVRGLSKTYGQGTTEVPALRDVDLAVEAGQFTAVLGPSGSGKSTLLQCMSGLEEATSGSVTVDDTELSGMREPQLTRLRRDRVGLVFQAFNLVSTLTALENITLPAAVAKKPVDKQFLDSVVTNLGLDGYLNHFPGQLSAEQQQLVACARAFVSQPAVIFADEPTGNLDSKTGEQVLSALRSAVSDLGQTVVLATHSPQVAAWADRIIVLSDGTVVDDADSSQLQEQLGDTPGKAPYAEPQRPKLTPARASTRPAAAKVEPIPHKPEPAKPVEDEVEQPSVTGPTWKKRLPPPPEPTDEPAALPTPVEHKPEPAEPQPRPKEPQPRPTETKHEDTEVGAKLDATKAEPKEPAVATTPADVEAAATTAPPIVVPAPPARPPAPRGLPASEVELREPVAPPTRPKPAQKQQGVPAAPHTVAPAPPARPTVSTPEVEVGVAQVEWIWDESETLPDTLDDIAPPKGLPQRQADIITRAQRILDALPGPVVDPDEKPPMTD